MSARISITVTVPELVLNSGTVRAFIMGKMQNKTAPDLQRMFRKTTEGWRDPPNFLQKFKNSPSEVSVTVWPGQNTRGGKVYSIVNEGSPAHRIVPRRAKMLRFQVGYTPSTRPRVLGSRAYSRFGETISSYGVNHPGFEARKFDATIAEQYADTFADDMQDAIRVATVRRG